MLSSLGFDTKLSARSSKNRSAPKYLEMPRSFSMHVFHPHKKPTPPTYSYNPAAVPIAKTDVSQDRGGVWSKPAGPRPAFERRPSTAPSVNHDNQVAVYEVPLEPKRSKSKSYGIYPSASNNMYIYESSISSSDALASSPSSESSSSESDPFPEIAMSAAVEISSTRASSSTETLETTALVPYSATSSRPHLPHSPTSSDWARITPDGNRVYPPGLMAPARAGIPASHSAAESPFDSESDSETYDETHLPPPPRPTVMVSRSASQAVPPPARRYSDERQPPRTREPLGDIRNVEMSSALPPQHRSDPGAYSRAPPGLASSASRQADGGNALGRAPSSMQADTRQTQRPPLARQGSGRYVDTQAVSSSSTVARDGSSNMATGASVPSFLTANPNSRDEGLRQDQSASQTAPGHTADAQTVLTVATRRCVRWTEDLMCPCPVPRSERRKGWFNRRGDQLWTNAGRFKTPAPGQEYPPDLTGYPEPNTGWMNEEGIRIDMEHRLIPKPPLRSALKRPKVTIGNP
ncbi:hypothetical protein WOLCODRAFT_139130, partial [Wolfiporia cocos MD-104 SS10]